jgi:hypothetical protein
MRTTVNGSTPVTAVIRYRQYKMRSGDGIHIMDLWPTMARRGLSLNVPAGLVQNPCLQVGSSQLSELRETRVTIALS